MSLVCPPPNLCISSVFNFSWDDFNTQAKWKTKPKVMQNFGLPTRCIMGDVQMENVKKLKGITGRHCIVARMAQCLLVGGANFLTLRCVLSGKKHSALNTSKFCKGVCLFQKKVWCCMIICKGKKTNFGFGYWVCKIPVNLPLLKDLRANIFPMLL